MGILKIFTPKQSSVTQLGGTNTPPNSQPNIQLLNPDARKDKETYSQWGARMCGKVGASVVALPAYLHAVYFDIKKFQAQNDALQDQLKQKIQIDLESNRNSQKLINSQIQNADAKINQIQNDINTLRSERQQILSEKERVNKEAKLKMVVGLVILIPLTIYLFVFYSSAFYSAFFKTFESVTGLSNAMFDANAVPSAFQEGFMEAIFILFAPIIFMGLGFILHFFGKGTGWSKYLKMTAIIATTLTFDIIIAYQIGKHIYDNWVLSQLQEFPPFDVHMAITDPNFWAVIFCGFIAYIIWGLVFNLVMDAYNNLDLTKSRNKHIDDEIKACESKIAKVELTKTDLQTKLTEKQDEEKRLQNELSVTIRYNINGIQQEMNNFFTGWLNSMSALGCSQSDQAKANNTYQETLKILNIQ